MALRKMTKSVGRWKEGDQRDYPISVWNKIASDLGQKLDSFSVLIEHNPVLQNPLKGRVQIHRRQGATQ